MLKKDILKIQTLKMKREIFGRREVTPEEEAKYAKINKIEEIKKLYNEYHITNDDIKNAKQELENNVLEKEQDVQDTDKDKKQEEFEIE